MEDKKDNEMREVKIERVVVSFSGVKETLDKGIKLLEKITKKKASKRKTSKRIPEFGIRPGLEVGCIVTIRGEEAERLLGKLLAAINNKLDKKQIVNNHFSFGIEEYIEIPGEEYDREIGITGFKVSVVFKRKGKRVKKKKIKYSKLPKKQEVTKDEIIDYMINKFETEIE